MRIGVFCILGMLTVLASCTQEKPQTRWCDELPRAAYQNLKKTDFGNEWFEVYQVQDSIYAIYEPYQWQEVISYLILGKTLRCYLIPVMVSATSMRLWPPLLTCQFACLIHIHILIMLVAMRTLILSMEWILSLPK